MSLLRFISRVRIAASPFSPEAWAAPARLLTSEFDQAVRFEDIWLAPVTVKGFADADLSGFPTAERERLREAVARFRAAADQVLPGAPAAEEQVREALTAFVTILEVLKPHFASDEAMRVRKAIWTACAPHRDWVLAFDFDLRQDSYGDPAVWAWLLLRDDVDVESRAVQLELYDIREAIRREFARAGVGRELYASVWGRSEMPEVLAWEPA